MTQMIQPQIQLAEREVLSPLQIATNATAKAIFHMAEKNSRCETITDFTFPNLRCNHALYKSECVLAGSFVFDHVLDVCSYVVLDNEIACDGIIIDANILVSTLNGFIKYPDEFLYQDFARRLLAAFPTTTMVSKDVTGFLLATVVKEHMVLLDFRARH